MTYRLPKIALLLAVLLCSGCVSDTYMAKRFAAKMQDPRTTPRKSLRYRQRLRTLGPAAHPYLSDAFFPIGLYDVPEERLQEIASAGFNLVVNGGKDARYLDRARAAGLRVIPYLRLSKMKEDAQRVRGKRSVVAWYLFDEPDLNKMPPEKYHQLAKELRRLDRTRPIYLTVWNPLRYGEFVEACDILAPNPYPIINAAPEMNELRWVAAVLDEGKALADDRPVWAIIQAFWAEPTWPRNPTPEELRAMVYLALNHGADGIIYFSYKSGDRPLVEHSELFSAITQINGQIQSLRGALLVEPSVENVRVEAVDEGEEGREDSGFDASLRQFGEAKLFIIVNPDPIARRARVLIENDKAISRRVELFSPKRPEPTPHVPGSPIHLHLDPFQVRVFWME